MDVVSHKSKVRQRTVAQRTFWGSSRSISRSSGGDKRRSCCVDRNEIRLNTVLQQHCSTRVPLHHICGSSRPTSFQVACTSRPRHERLTWKTVEFLQSQFINKVDDDRAKVQRQVPKSKWRCEETVDKSQNSVQRQNGGYPVVQQRTDATGAVPEREAKIQIPVRKVQKKIEIPQVTACTGNRFDSKIRRMTALEKTFRRARYSQLGCGQDCQRNSQSLEHPVRDSRDHLSRLDQAGNGDAGGSRTPSNVRRVLQSEGDQQSELSLTQRGKQHDCATVLDSNHQHMIPVHILHRNRSSQDITVV